MSAEEEIQLKTQLENNNSNVGNENNNINDDDDANNSSSNNKELPYDNVETVENVQLAKAGTISHQATVEASPSSIIGQATELAEIPETNYVVDQKNTIPNTKITQNNNETKKNSIIRNNETVDFYAERNDFELDHSLFTAGQVKFLKNVIKCCQSEWGFDIYQLMAFDGNSHTSNNRKDRAKYFLNIVKSTLCALTQIFGICIIIADFVQEGLESKDWCNPPNYEHSWSQIFYDSNLKILSFLFSSFLSYFSIDALMDVEHGMYKKMKYAKTLKWINSIWLTVGLSVNIFVSIIAVYGSFLVIFFSDNSLDMVLNSVALFFVVELDDLLVKQTDYERIYRHVQQFQTNVAQQNDTDKDENNNQKCACIQYCICCFNAIGTFIAWLYTLPFQIVRYGTVLLCIFIPFYVGYCY